MASYPVQILRASDLQRVPNIGPVIATRLTKKWSEVWGQGGPEPLPGFVQPTEPFPSEPKPPKPKRQRTKKDTTQNLPTSSDPRMQLLEAALHDELTFAQNFVNGVPPSPPQPAKVSKPRKPKAYCPGYRTGGYALLIALYKESHEPPHCNWMNKADLIAKAQPLCDASFTDGKDQGGFKITAWRAMNTLVDKDLVWRDKHPPRFGLTEAGETLAKALYESSLSQERPSPQQKPSRHNSQPHSQIDYSDSEMPKETVYEKLPPTIPRQPSIPIYDSDDDVIDLSEPIRPVAGSGGLSSSQLDEPDSVGLYRSWSQEQQQRPLVVLTPRKQKRRSDDYGPSDVELPSSQCAAESQESGFIPFGNKWLPKNQIMSSPVRATSQSSFSQASASMPASYSQGSLPSVGDSQSSTASLRAMTSQTTLDSFRAWQGTPLFLKRGTFEIIMILDKREKKSNQSDNGYIANRLAQKGVKVDTRVLELGDILWVAREKGETRTAREFVLDYVIERKAIDDLRSSIFEGRFDEQRTRLSNCGLFQVSFLVEGLIPKADTVFTGERGEHVKSIQSAMALLQVRSNFFVKHTTGLEQTLDYLQQMTNFITQLHENQDLYALPQGSFDKKNWLEARRLAEVRDNRRYHITFDSYNDINVKTKNMVLKDLYVKQLMCIPGVTAEKSVEIVKRYPTLIELVEAMENHPTEQGKIQFFESITKNEVVLSRKLTRAPAQKLSILLGHPTYPATWPRV